MTKDQSRTDDEFEGIETVWRELEFDVNEDTNHGEPTSEDKYDRSQDY